MLDINSLIKIRVFDKMEGKNYPLLGFRCKGDDRVGFNVCELVLYDANNRQTHVVPENQFHRLQIINE